MRRNRTNRKHALVAVEAATWQPSAGMCGARLSVNCPGTLPTNFIGGGLAQRQARSIESQRLSDSRYSHNQFSGSAAVVPAPKSRIKFKGLCLERARELPWEAFSSRSLCCLIIEVPCERDEGREPSGRLARCFARVRGPPPLGEVCAEVCLHERPSLCLHPYFLAYPISFCMRG